MPALIAITGAEPKLDICDPEFQEDFTMPILIMIVASALCWFIAAPAESRTARTRRDVVPALDIDAACKYVESAEQNRRPVPGSKVGTKPDRETGYAA
jgi:hypothetical protein